MTEIDEALLERLMALGEALEEDGEELAATRAFMEQTLGELTGRLNGVVDGLVAVETAIAQVDAQVDTFLTETFDPPLTEAEAEIAKRAKVIRQGWTPEERELRRVAKEPRAATPVVPLGVAGKRPLRRRVQAGMAALPKEWL